MTVKKIKIYSPAPTFRFHYFLLLLLALILVHSVNARSESGNMDDYEPDGHYWTVLVVTTLLKIEHAQEIAYIAEYPDNVINKDGYCVRTRFTFLFPGPQKKIHALTGGDPVNERNISLCLLAGAKTPEEIGTALHRLGDSFAHINDKKGKMYPHVIGHTLLWKKPDKIRSNPDKYLQYVHTLIVGLGGNPEELDLTVFNYIARANLDSESNAAILKAEYNLINGSIAFNIEEDHLSNVEKYMHERLSEKNQSFAVHSSTDGKGRKNITIILTTPGNQEKSAALSVSETN